MLVLACMHVAMNQPVAFFTAKIEVQRLEQVVLPLTLRENNSTN